MTDFSFKEEETPVEEGTQNGTRSDTLDSTNSDTGSYSSEGMGGLLSHVKRALGLALGTSSRGKQIAQGTNLSEEHA